MQQVRVNGKRGLASLVLGNGDLVLFGKGKEFGARRQIPFAPWCDHLDVGVQCVG